MSDMDYFSLKMRASQQVGEGEQKYEQHISGAELRDGKWVAGDADYVKRIANLSDMQEQFVSYVYKEAVSPHLAARKEGNPVELAKVKVDFDAASNRHEFVFAEGSGGIICPIRYDDQKIFLVDIMKMLDLPLLIVTTAALGSINACVLTVEYARSRGLDVRGLIVNRYGSSGNLEMEDDNIRMMQDLTGLEVIAKVKDGDTDLGVQPF